jgi:hypothetical protein
LRQRASGSTAGSRNRCWTGPVQHFEARAKGDSAGKLQRRSSPAGDPGWMHTAGCGNMRWTGRVQGLDRASRHVRSSSTCRVSDARHLPPVDMVNDSQEEQGLDRRWTGPEQGFQPRSILLVTPLPADRPLRALRVFVFNLSLVDFRVFALSRFRDLNLSVLSLSGDPLARTGEMAVVPPAATGAGQHVYSTISHESYLLTRSLPDARHRRTRRRACRTVPQF